MLKCLPVRADIGRASGVAADFYKGAVKMSYPAQFSSDSPVEITLASIDVRPGELRYLERHIQHTQALLPLSGKPYIAVMSGQRIGLWCRW